MKGGGYVFPLLIVVSTLLFLRFAMVVDNGKVVELNVEPDGTGMTCSLSDNILQKLSAS